jgi:hypothetical protein
MATDIEGQAGPPGQDVQETSFILHLTKILPTRAQGSEIIHENEAFRLSPTPTTTTKMEIFNEDPTYNTPAPLFPSDHNL